jgi:2-iminobutanoate/2-iminopropanoate deaminase
MSADRVPITAPDAPVAAGPYSHAVRAGELLFLAGQIPLDPATGALVEGGVGAQTAQCLRNLEAVCRAAGTRLSAAVRCGVFVTEMSVFAEVNDAYASFFPSDPPARTTIGVAALPLGARVEIDAIVALG